MTFDQFNLEWKPAIESALERVLDQQAEGPAEALHQAMRYAVLGGGKRFRPLLALAMCRAVCGEPERALPAACATELIHCFSLVHDDLPCMDDDDLRRGKPACHVKFGEATALLAGDALLALAFQCALEGGMAVPRTDSPGATLRVLGALTRAVGVQGMVGGQVGDMLLQGERPTLKRVNWIHSRKTGALISAAAEVGAISGGADDERAAAAARFGAEVGLAFQIRDDLLNELSPTAQTGKSGGSDRERGKVTYPAAVGVEEAERLMLEAVERASLLARSFADDGLLEDIARSAAQRSA